jgi:phosphatidylserine/phosphatidylglycerophosphate/cardiolipin synthase-like enzyme
MTEFIKDREIYERVICGLISKTKKFLWLATADLKDLHVDKNGKKVPFLEILSDLVKKNVEIRLLHAKEPGPVFRKDFDRYPNLISGMERILCPRVHLKSVIVDGQVAYIGSANLTGAGMGAKSPNKRNFEDGIITTEQNLVNGIMGQFDDIWRGSLCRSCRRKEYCADHRDLLLK